MNYPELADKANCELKPGEVLLYCDYSRIPYWVIVMVVSFCVGFISVGISSLISPDTQVTLKVSWIINGVFITLSGINAFMSRKNYFFVTDKRVCFRGCIVFGIAQNMDYPFGPVKVANNKKYKEILIIRKSDAKVLTVFQPRNYKKMYDVITEAVEKHNDLCLAEEEEWKELAREIWTNNIAISVEIDEVERCGKAEVSETF